MQQLKWISLALVFSLIMMACNKEPEDFTLGENFSLDFTECSSGMEDMVEVCFRSVTQDTRCPCDAVCVSAGLFIVNVMVTIDNRDSLVELTSSKAGQRATIGDYAISLESISPDCLKKRESTEAIDYTVELLVEAK